MLSIFLGPGGLMVQMTDLPIESRKSWGGAQEAVGWAVFGGFLFPREARKAPLRAR